MCWRRKEGAHWRESHSLVGQHLIRKQQKWTLGWGEYQKGLHAGRSKESYLGDGEGTHGGHLPTCHWEMVKGHMEDICPHAPENRDASTSVENGSEWSTQMKTSMHPAKNVGSVHERGSAVSAI